jgi:hypothetical protein
VFTFDMTNGWSGPEMVGNSSFIPGSQMASL